MKKGKTKNNVIDKYAKYSEIGEMYSSKRRKVDLFLPSNFRMLCAILNVKPEDVIRDFMWMVSYSSLDRGKEKQRKAAKKFFLSCNFGRLRYSRKDIKKMFRELKAVRTIYGTTENMDCGDKELFWKNNHMYTIHWFKRWFEKNTRKDNISMLAEY